MHKRYGLNLGRDDNRKPQLSPATSEKAIMITSKLDPKESSRDYYFTSQSDYTSE